jgi:mono/diheme cytochrome c family protein
MTTNRSQAAYLLRRGRAALVCATLCGLIAQRAIADAIPATPQAARGEHIARLICSACHVVAQDQEFPPILTKPAPSFAEIANRPGVTAGSLQRFIVGTHWDTDTLPMTMPNPMLTADQAHAVSRYILSLRTH